MVHFDPFERTAYAARFTEFRARVYPLGHLYQIDFSILDSEGVSFLFPVVIEIKRDLSVFFTVLCFDRDCDVFAESLIIKSVFF